MGQKRRAGKPARKEARRREWPVAVLAALILLAGVLAYASSFDGAFVADDEEAIVRNESIRSLSTAGAPPRNTTVAGRPVLNLSFAVNYELGGREPWGYHALNLAIHLCAALVLFGAVRRTLLAPALAPRFDGSATSIAFAVALLWVVHPLNTAAVTYVVQRAESLMGLFFLLTMYAALRAEQSRKRGWALLAVAACGLGMATKEVMMVAPILVALSLWILHPGTRFAEPGRRTLLAGLAATWVVLGALATLAPRGASVGFTIGGWTPVSYLRTQAEVVMHYLRLAVYPDPLVFMYSWPPALWRDVIPEFLLLAALATVTLVLAVRRHPASLPGLWCFLILAPSSSLLPIATEVAAEHRMYLPLAAVIAVVVVTVAAAVRVKSAAGAAVVCALAFVLGATTHARNKDYRSVEALMRDTVDNSPSNLRARVIYGGHLLGLERYAEAEGQLRVAITLPQRMPADQGLVAAAHMYLGSSLAAQGRLDEAIPLLQNALERSPTLSEAHAFLGEAYASQGRLEDAATAYGRAVELMPHVEAVVTRAAEVTEMLSQEQARAGNSEQARLTHERALEWRRRAAAARAPAPDDRRQ